MEIKVFGGNIDYIEITKIDESIISQCRHEVSMFEPLLQSPDKTGSAENEDGTVRKSNKGIFFHDIYTPEGAKISPCANLFSTCFEHIKSIDDLPPKSSLNAVHTVKGFQMLFSAYSEKDYYHSHRDLASLTMLFWMSDGDISGGDLTFTDFGRTINFENGKMILFPSFYNHEVSEVKLISENAQRYCISAFME